MSLRDIGITSSAPGLIPTKSMRDRPDDFPPPFGSGRHSRLGESEVDDEEEGENLPLIEKVEGPADARKHLVNLGVMCAGFFGLFLAFGYRTSLLFHNFDFLV